LHIDYDILIMMKTMLIYLNLGSNVEPRQEYLRRALEAISRGSEITLARSSRLYETPAIGLSEANAPPFLNLCAGIRTSLTPQKILQRAQEIERELGRAESTKGKRLSRTIDIDIVLAEDMVIERPDLTIPHPGLLTRSFFLWPLIEICPSASWPPTRLPLRRLLLGGVEPPILRTLPGLGPD
jgi:2-amino-4-hydroxy-6-hydroxymethyldihydropteridine diphosphokinase